MKLTALVENTSTDKSFSAAHGLSFYIETADHRILFDVGPDVTLLKNARRHNISLEDVDTVIISHGHYDHGGMLKQFLELNKTATVYIQRSAFEASYSKSLGSKKYIGLDKNLKTHPQIMLLDGDYVIDEELSLFVSHAEDPIKSEANNTLYGPDGLDDFKHEQNLLIREEKDVLFMGCGHRGVISILQSAPFRPEYCFGGFHTYNPTRRKTIPQTQLDKLADALTAYKDIEFYTCHCTGKEAYEYLSSKQANIHYIACGDHLEIKK